MKPGKTGANTRYLLGSTLCAMPPKPHGHCSSWTRGLLAALVAAAWAGAAWGQEAEPPVDGMGLRVSGFGTLGLSHVRAPEGWGFRRELSQSGTGHVWRQDVDTRLGVQLNYGLGSRLELVAQAIVRKRGEHAPDGDALEWAYASYRATPDWTLRVGRVNVDAFLMADYRNVGYGFTMVRPPVELYARLPTTLDGADVARSWFQGDAQWRAKLMYGSGRIGDLHTGRASRIRDVSAAMLSREESGLLLRASVSRARVTLDQAPLQPALDGLAQLGALPVPAVAGEARALRERLGATGIWATFLELGVRHELADWQWSAEFVRVTARPLTVENSGYVTLGRRLDDWTPYLAFGRVSSAVAALPPPAWQDALTPVIGAGGAIPAQMLGDAVTASLNGVRTLQSTWSLGLRWDFHAQAALKLQWDRVRVRGGGASLWTDAGGQATTAQVVTAAVDFIF